MNESQKLVLEKLQQILATDYKGPKVGFAEAHVLKALLTLGSHGSVGRGKLGIILNLGLGEVRTLIKRLKDAGLITIEERGCSLTSLGRKEWTHLRKLIPWSSSVEGEALRLGGFCWTINVRGRHEKVKKGIEQRDAAVKAGANGALTVIYSSGKFRIPPLDDKSEVTTTLEPWATIKSLGVKDGDLLIISGSDDLMSAEYGALSAALTIL